MTLTAILLIVWAHWIGDFILQSDWHAKNKSKNSWILAHHVTGYILPFIAVGFFIPISFAWLIINWVGHFCTDYITSRITSKLWERGEVHWFFAVIGADQAIHFTMLFVSYMLLLPYMV